jgi:hypothetical protein
LQHQWIVLAGLNDQEQKQEDHQLDRENGRDRVIESKIMAIGTDKPPADHQPNDKKLERICSRSSASRMFLEHAKSRR